MFILPVVVCAQDADKLIFQAKQFENKLLFYNNIGAPELIQGAWRATSAQGHGGFKYLYITYGQIYRLESLNLLYQNSNAQPGDYEKYSLRNNTVSNSEWNYIATGYLSGWLEGQIKLVDSSNINMRTRHFASIDQPSGQETVIHYSRVIPRPGPFYSDFLAGQATVPSPLVGDWISSSDEGFTYQMTFQQALPGKPFSIRLTNPINPEEPGHPALWNGGVFITWGSGNWWLRTGSGVSAVQVFFELSEDGCLQVTPKSNDDQDQLASASSKVMIFKKIK